MTLLLLDDSTEAELAPVRGLAAFDLKVRSLDVDRKEVTWKISDYQGDIYDFDLQVLRSESPEGPFEAISPLRTDTYS